VIKEVTCMMSQISIGTNAWDGGHQECHWVTDHRPFKQQIWVLATAFWSTV
jgi:hypothetical protein